MTDPQLPHAVADVSALPAHVLRRLDLYSVPGRREWLEALLQRLATRYPPRAQMAWLWTPRLALRGRAPLALLPPDWQPGDACTCTLEALLSSEGM